MAVTPNAGLPANEEVVVGFTLQFTYVNTPSPDRKEQALNALTSRVYIVAGKVQEADA